MIKLINKSNEKLSLKTDMSINLANALRRSVNQIPILAVDSLEITKNDSALYDEIISHRLGLVPIKNEKLKLAKECDCGKEEGCSKCSIKLKLSQTEPGVVYSDQLSPKDSNVYKMPITVLDKDQEIEFVAIAKVGLGKDHAKYSPGLLYYRYEDDLENEDNDEAFKKKIEDAKKNNKPLDIFIDSWGQITAKEIFIEAVEALNRELKSFVKEIK